MLKAQKKISKRELKQDALITTMGNLTTFYDVNKKNIGIAVAGVAVLVLGIWWYTQNLKTNNEQASTALGSVYSYVDNNQFQIAIDGVPERKITGLKSIVDKYRSTDAGNLARFYLANAYFHLGKYDEALEQFEDFKAKDQFLAVSRLAGIAQCHEAKGEYEKAADNFEKASVDYPKDVEAAANLNNAANDYMLAGKKERALELFKKLKKEYPTSQYARDADRFITRLTS